MNEKYQSFLEKVAELSAQSIEQIRNRFCELTFNFVVGAPAMISENIATMNKISNGSKCILHSIVLDPESSTYEDDKRSLERASNVTNGDEIFLLSPPLYVNVEIMHVDSNHWDSEATMVPGKIVIPLPVSSSESRFKPQEMKDTRAKMKGKKCSKELKYY